MHTKTIITCIQNILPLFSTNLKHNIKLTNNLIFTNKYNSTLQQYKYQIDQISRLRNCSFVYNYQPALNYLRNINKNKNVNEKINDSKDKNGQVIMLVGLPCLNLYKQMKKQKVITLEQICGLFPQKVPLSYRSKQNSQIRKKVQKRIGIPLQKQPHINKIYYTSQQIKMWDQAIQVIIDHQPSQNIIQFQHSQPKTNFYQLTMQDFIKGVQKTYQIVHNHDLPNVVDFNKQNRQIQWFLQKLLAPLRQKNRVEEQKYKKQNKDANQFKNRKRDYMTVIVDQDLINNADQLRSKYEEVLIQRVDQNSSLWS